MLTVLCIALVMVFGTVQVTHGHNDNGATDDAHAVCSLCVVTHAGVQVAVAPVTLPGVEVIEVEPQPVALPHVVAPPSFPLSIRPPPAASTPA